jgi:hypothetical protein
MLSNAGSRALPALSYGIAVFIRRLPLFPCLLRCSVKTVEAFERYRN